MLFADTPIEDLPDFIPSFSIMSAYSGDTLVVEYKAAKLEYQRYC